MKLNDVCRRVDRAVRLGAHSYASRLCESILEFFPGDARTRTLLGQACLGAGDLDRARHLFDLALEYDPEETTALASLGVVHSSEGRLGAAVKAFERAYDLNPANQEVRDSLVRLYAERDGAPTAVATAPPVAVARWRLRHEPLENALDAANALLVSQPGNVAVAIARAEALWRHGRFDDAERACRQILTRHPRFLKPRLILGLILVSDPRREIEGVELLHLALADDPSGAVVGGLLVTQPITLPILGSELDLPISAEQLEPPPEFASALDVPTAASSGEGEPEWQPPTSALAAIEPVTAAKNSRSAAAPIAGRSEATGLRQHLFIVSSRARLINRYGSEGFERIERRLQATRRELAEFGVAVTAAFFDDLGSLSELGVEPATDGTAESVRRVIGDLLGKAGEATAEPLSGSVLILGGDEIVPYFRLPNPALDDDPAILTDAPYAAAEGESIYRPSRVVGRLPDAGSASVSPLLRSLDNLTEARRRPMVAPSTSGIFRAGLSMLGALGRGFSTSPVFAAGLAEWNAVVTEVVGNLADGPTIRLSPPVTFDAFNVHWLSDRRFLHFALHGDTVGKAWYGQVVYDAETNDPFLPVTMDIEQLAGADLAGPIVFADASYAGNVVGKTIAQSLALRFLAEGAAAVVAPTGLAYGSPHLPLSGGDLLGYLFWTEIRRGVSVGEALRTARRQFQAHLLERQGYLDGEDQKLLLQYALYGDPSLVVCQAPPPDPDEIVDDVPPAPVLCVGGSAESRSSPLKLRHAMEQLVEQCPGVVPRGVRVHRQGLCDGRCEHPGHADAPRAEIPPVTTVAARLDLPTDDGGQVVKIARITLDPDGGVQKLLVSR